jgi:hypothetical protein
MRFSHSLDRLGVTFDDDHAVANAGLVLTATLAERLGLRALLDERVDLGDTPGRANVGHKAMTLIHSALADGDCIDDAAGLCAGATGSVLGHELRAPSTLGTFLRSFSWGDVRSLDAVSRELLRRAWAAGAGPGDEALTIDVDSTICETYGLAKEGGSRFTYNHLRGYHPLVAVVAGTGDIVHARLRGGNANSGRAAANFLAETFARVRSAGARGEITLRADSGFYTKKVIDTCRRGGARFSVTVRLQKGLHTAIAAIPDEDWTPIPYFLDGADVAETDYRPFGEKDPVRLIVRRVRPTPGSQLALFCEFSHHAFITDRQGDTLALEADHRRHADVENTIRDLKYGVGLNHFPSGRFGANGAWLALNVMAHNLARWTTRIGFGETLVRTKTFRRHHLALPGRLTCSGRRLWLHLPSRWPWREDFLTALGNLRAVVLLS